jgi:very-short-patch-repair endonuclease
MTEPEVLLWSFLKGRQMGTKFRRQVPIGRFIVDFASFECRLVVEVDGHHHQPDADARREAWIESRGWRVARFWAGDVFGDLNAVLDAIENLVRAPRGST